MLTPDPSGKMLFVMCALPGMAGGLGSELIVMGTRGLGAVHHALIGSVALKVAHASAVPVILVP